MILRFLRLSALLIFVCTLPSYVQAQAFNSFNQRNHPEIEWVEAETPHFRLIYSSELRSIIPEIAAIAESSYVALSNGLGVQFDRKIKVYLSNEDEIVNGAATFLNGSYTYIWVELNDSHNFFSGDKKWFRKVLAHELAHLFQFEAQKSNMGIWGFLFGNTGSRSLTEGYAQFATEVWDAQRGDRWLRASIFEDKPDYNDGLSPYSGRLVYAKGYAQQLFIADQYGDSTIAKAFAYRDTLFLGLTYPNFYTGFEKSTGEKWKLFENRWLKHTNIYYNTLASQMDRTDSLYGKKIKLQNQLIYDFKISPSGKRAVSHSFQSMEMPISKTILFESDSTGFKSKKVLFLGSINPDLTWSTNENTLFYSKIDRAKNGSLVNDIYSYNIKRGKETRLSFNQRLRFPQYLENGKVLAIQNQKGTGNIVEYSLSTKQLTNVTDFPFDTQVLYLRKNPVSNEVTFSKIDNKGNRTIEVLNLDTNESKSYTTGEIDDRNPIYSPDGKFIVFNSLRDKVPNIFVINLELGTIERATYVFNGAEVLDWGLTSSGSSTWIVKSSESKSEEFIFEVSDSIRTTKSNAVVPNAYSSWTKQQPSFIIGGNIEPNPSLLSSEKEYSSFSNVNNFISFGLPYAGSNNGEDDYGLQGVSLWTDPLGKHSFALAGNLSLVNQEYTYGVAQYVNNTNSFSLAFDAFRVPGSFQFYSDNLLLNLISGFSVGISKPLDWKPKAYSFSRFMLTTRAFKWEPSSSSLYENRIALNFSDAWQNDIIATYEIKHLLPYIHNDIHPLTGFGMNISLKSGINASNSWFGDAQKSFAILDFRWFDVRPLFKEITWYSYFRSQAQFGSPLPYESVQLSRYDNFSLPSLNQLPLTTWNNPDRVRGYRTFILADQLQFSSFELRAPLLPSLGTKILGLIRFDKTTFALFSDVAFASSINSGASSTSLWQWGLGGEIKNKLNLFGIPIIHSLGYAQPYHVLFQKNKPNDVYYKIQASIPF